MNREEFMQYIADNFNISGEAGRLISNILIYVENHFVNESEQYDVLTELLDGTIGLEDTEIRKVYL